MGLSRTVAEINGDFSRKSQMFPIPVYLSPQMEFLLQFGIGAWRQKTTMMVLPGRGLTIPLAVWIQYTNVTGGQRDRLATADFLVLWQTVRTSRYAPDCLQQPTPSTIARTSKGFSKHNVTSGY